MSGAFWNICGVHWALCSMLYALCSMRFALCALLYAPCALLYAPCATMNQQVDWRSNDMQKKIANLKELIHTPEILILPGAHEGISARIAAELGFKALFCSDFGCSAVVLGKPDYGIISLTEMVDQIRSVAAISNLPLLGDGGCGYGNTLNVFRTVQEYERAGAAGMTLEDQIFPKRCQHLEGKEVIDIDAMVEKIKAALKARTSSDFIISARTDSIQPLGLQEAITRANAFYEAGADLVVPAAIPSKADIQEFVDKVQAPVMIK